MMTSNKYSDTKIAWFPSKLESFRTGEVTAPIYVRVKPTNHCNHDCFFCLVAGTRVVTETGNVPIEKIKPGHRIRSPDGRTSVVMDVGVRTVNEVVIINCNGHRLEASVEHPLLTLEGWKKAGDFRVGDRAFVRVRLWPPSETIQADLEQVLQESPAKNGSLLEGQGRAVASFGKSDTGFCIADLKLERNLEPRTVDSVQVIRKHTIVYSFSCAPVHAFVANGFVVHNCAYKSSFSGMHELSPDRESTWDGPVAELPTAKLLEVLDDFRDMGVKAVTYSGGGEPLMHPAIVTVMERTLELGIHLSIITNGQLLMAERAKTLGRAKWVRVSVDYQNAQQMHEHRHVPERMFGALLNNLQNFARLKQPQCDLYLNYIVHKGNCESLTEAARLFFEVGVENIRFSPVWTPDFQAYHAPIRARVEQQLLEIRQSLRLGQTVNTTYDLASSAHSIERGYHRCFFMEMVPVVAADGNVYACHNKAYDAKGMIGTIRDKRFKALWFSPEAKEFFKTLDPTVMCRHQCANDGKNLFIHQLLASHGDNFV